ncbi:hypothetical protein B7494_g3000 [Chlorociboria aeruginascens]|nr:hypothetical protein B7494_g3000 [Chlorociboria aeruginascens]
MVALTSFLRAVIIVSTAYAAFPKDRFFRRQDANDTVGTNLYNCHDNCGEAILEEEVAGFCNTTIFAQDYASCLQCSGPDNEDIWQYYGPYLTAGAIECGSATAPLSGTQPDVATALLAQNTSSTATAATATTVASTSATTTVDTVSMASSSTTTVSSASASSTASGASMQSKALSSSVVSGVIKTDAGLYVLLGEACDSSCYDTNNFTVHTTIMTANKVYKLPPNSPYQFIKQVKAPKGKEVRRLKAYDILTYIKCPGKDCLKRDYCYHGNLDYLYERGPFKKYLIKETTILLACGEDSCTSKNMMKYVRHPTDITFWLCNYNGYQTKLERLREKMKPYDTKPELLAYKPQAGVKALKEMLKNRINTAGEAAAKEAIQDSQEDHEAGFRKVPSQMQNSLGTATAPLQP